ncbi:MAG: hypothetical protein AAGJ53_05390 [Pseudomonadota bacterium]
MRADLAPFVSAFPWLQELDDATLARLDPADWHLPEPEADESRSAVEAEMAAHVMTYRKEAQGVHDALTSLLEPAQLTDEQVDLLRKTEQSLANCLLVAYARPLQTRRFGAKREGRRTRR